jgi:hypothetical protein
MIANGFFAVGAFFTLLASLSWLLNSFEKETNFDFGKVAMFLALPIICFVGAAVAHFIGLP